MRLALVRAVDRSLLRTITLIVPTVRSTCVVTERQDQEGP